MGCWQFSTATYSQAQERDALLRIPIPIYVTYMFLLILAVTGIPFVGNVWRMQPELTCNHGCPTLLKQLSNSLVRYFYTSKKSLSLRNKASMIPNDSPYPYGERHPPQGYWRFEITIRGFLGPYEVPTHFVDCVLIQRLYLSQSAGPVVELFLFDFARIANKIRNSYSVNSTQRIKPIFQFCVKILHYYFTN